jgi:leucyl-tRNA synthetase
MARYEPKKIEAKWQQVWEETGIYRASEDPGRPKHYVLEYFPYPSGAAMHVGHVRNYTIGDTLARFSRMQGRNVLHPMGWDAFGLPAENYAIKSGISPQQAIEENTAKFRQQLMQMGFSYDWSREVNSTDPAYYKWTQWFFLLLFKRGLAYRQESLQWWCPVDQTVLANEQVEAGKCWRCGSVVGKKALKQWFFKITDYADRLIDDLEDLDWTESIKAMQRNWIGRSRGAEIDFKVVGGKAAVRVFTTRPDTLFGATFMVLAPEHPLVGKITTPKHHAVVQSYIKAAQAKSDIERQETEREKTGVFTGAYAVNPVNREKIPVWVADYVLPGYGTGAIMAVPAHDQRDHEFALRFGLPIRHVIDPSAIRDDAKDLKDFIRKKKIVTVVENSKGQLLSLNWGPKLGGRLFVGGTIEDGEDPATTAIREVTEETGYTDLELVAVGAETFRFKYYAFAKKQAVDADTNFVHLRLRSARRQKQALTTAEQDNFAVEWVSVEQADNEITEPLHRYAFDKFIRGQCFNGEGVMVRSGRYDGQESAAAREKIVADLVKKKLAAEKVNYRMRDWLISRQRYWGAPIPIVHCAKCGIVPVPDDQLPVVLPEIKSYEPSGDGRSPLAAVGDWVKTDCPQCAGPAERETDTMDGFACSSWYFLRFADPHNEKAAFDPAKARFWLPVDDYIGGAEHAVMHLLYARFWVKVMYDAELIEFEEPFTTLRNQGMILAPDGAKMSKSKGNTIEPDGLIEKGYGADAIRLMELFIGPWNQSANWSVEGIGGTFRFLQRVWTLTQEWLAAGDDAKTAGRSGAVLARLSQKAARQVTQDLNDLGFNTAIATLMETVNVLYRQKAELGLNDPQWRPAIETLLKLLAPFAPHIAEELWHQIGHEESVHLETWPTWDEALIADDLITIVVQVNGRVRDRLLLPADADEATVAAEAKTRPKVDAYLRGKPSRKTIYVPGKLINFVI